jgi:hypothetical protein
VKRVWLAVVAVSLAACGDDAFKAFCTNHPGACDGAGGGSATGGGRADSGTGGGTGGGVTGGGTGGGVTGGGTGGGVMGGGTGAGLENWFAGDAGEPVDGGWSSLCAGLSGTAVRAFAISPDAGSAPKLFAATNGGLFKSTDDGDHWTEVPLGSGGVGLPGDVQFVGYSPSNPRVLYAYAFSADSYRSYVSSDDGMTWSDSIIATGTNANSIGFAFDPGDEKHAVLAMGTNRGDPTVQETFNLGQTWAPVSFTDGGSPDAPLAVAISKSPSRLLCITRLGLLARPKAGGFRGADMGSANGQTISSASFLANPDGGIPLAILSTGSPSHRHLYLPVVDATGEPAWVAQATELPASGAAVFSMDEHGNLYLVDNLNQTFAVSSDLGTTWVDRGSTPEPTADQRNLLEPLTVLPNGDLWAGSQSPQQPNFHPWDNGPWLMTAGSTNWVRKSTNLCTNAMEQIAVDPFDSNHAIGIITVASTRTREFIETFDGGAGWSAPSNAFPNQPKSIQFDAFNPHQLLVGDIANHFFRNTDAGWSDLWLTNATDVVLDPVHDGGVIAVTYATTTYGFATFGGTSTVSAQEVNGLAVSSVAFPWLSATPGDAIVSYGTTVESWAQGTTPDPVSSTHEPCTSLATPLSYSLACSNVNGSVDRSGNRGNGWVRDATAPRSQRLVVDHRAHVMIWSLGPDGVALSPGPGQWIDRNLNLPTGAVIPSTFTQGRSDTDTIYLSIERRGVWKTTTAGR